MLEQRHHTVVAKGRGQKSSGSLSSSSAGPGDREGPGAEAWPSAPRCASEQSLPRVKETSLTGDHGDDGGVSVREDGKMVSTFECKGATAVMSTKNGLQKEVSPLESARILGETTRRVSDLESRILPRNHSDEGGSLAALSAGATEYLTAVSSAPGDGGAFARLVVIKELQPVPDHAPEDARHLLELTLDHQQVVCFPRHCSASGTYDFSGGATSLPTS